jgi:DNA polymerase-3 subunit delta'
VFDESTVGHAGVRRRLLERLASGGLPGALLLAGPEAVGKRRVAMELAMRELCLARSACGRCAACAAFLADPPPRAMPNMLRIAPEGKAGLIRVDSIRGDGAAEGGVAAWAHLAPPPGCHRWVLVEDAHRLGRPGANMLLKVREEPPPGAFFLLLTHRPESVLPTIRSRAERVAFGPLDEGSLRGVAAGRGWGGQDMDALLALSGGTLKYLERGAFQRACSQVGAWLSVMEGAPFRDASASLLPDRDSEVAQGRQVAEALELLLLLLGERERAKCGLPGRLARLDGWGDRIRALAGRRLDAAGGLRRALGGMGLLGRSAAPEPLLRGVALALDGG